MGYLKHGFASETRLTCGRVNSYEGSKAGVIIAEVREMRNPQQQAGGSPLRRLPPDRWAVAGPCYTFSTLTRVS